MQESFPNPDATGEILGYVGINIVSQGPPQAIMNGDKTQVGKAEKSQVIYGDELMIMNFYPFILHTGYYKGNTKIQFTSKRFSVL